jgi:hypothetical protein
MRQGRILARRRSARVAALARDTGRFTLEDSLGVQLTASECLRPEFALKDGRLHRADSPLISMGGPDGAPQTPRRS